MLTSRPPIGTRVIVRYNASGCSQALSTDKLEWRLNSRGTVVDSTGSSYECVMVRFDNNGNPKRGSVFLARLELDTSLKTAVPLCRAVDML